MLQVIYRYNEQKYFGTVTRTYREDGYYKKGGRITIKINPNAPEDIK
jgi:hypothetical protein